MAFCKFCGNEIPDGTVCSCPGAQAAAQGGNAAPAGGYDPAFGGGDTGVGGGAAGIKKLIPLICAGVAALVVIIVLFNLLSPKAQAKSALKKYVKAKYNKTGAAKYYEMQIPESILKEYKSDHDDEYDEMIDDRNESVEDLLEDYKGFKLKKITNVKKLKNSALKGATYGFIMAAEGYGLDEDEIDIEVTKGYQIKYKVEYKDEDGDKDTDKYTACVVKVKGDGWKVIPGTEAKDLEDLGEDYEDYLDAKKNEKKKSSKDEDDD